MSTLCFILNSCAPMAMAGPGFFLKTLSLASNSRLLFNARPVQITHILGIKKKTGDKLAELDVPEKPKRPLTAYFRFIQDRRSQVVKQHPEWKITEVSKQMAADWKSVDPAVKEKYESDYRAELETYAKRCVEYSEKLTDEQKQALQEHSKDVKSAKVKRKRKKKLRENNKPKKPVGAYIMFVMEHAREGKKYPQLLSELKGAWAELPPERKAAYTEAAAKAAEQYKEELREWETKMIKEGNVDIVRTRTLMGKPVSKPKKE